MDAILKYLEMGGYAAYVWPSYALSLVVIVGLTVHALMERRRTLSLLEQVRSTARS